MSVSENSWQLSTQLPHRLAGSAGSLRFVGGAADLDASGYVRHPGDLDTQMRGSLANADEALAAVGCGLEDAMRLKVFYESDGQFDEWDVIASVVDGLATDPLPVISLVPVPMQPFDGQAIQVQVIAQPGWRDLDDIRVVSAPVPNSHHARMRRSTITSTLRSGEVIVAANRTGHEAGPDAVDQSHAVMHSLADDLAAVGASLQDSVKMEGCYSGTSRADWAPLALARAAHFKEPGPAATMVPSHVLWPASAKTKIDVIAMRAVRNGFDKYIPRIDCWPERAWDWPLELPYRQAISLRNAVWLGGQVPSEPFSNSGERVAAGDLPEQTRFIFTYIEELLAGFGLSASDLALAVCYFRSSGDQRETEAFLDLVAEHTGGVLPPMTLVPVPHMQTPDSTVEIWGVAPHAIAL